MTSTFRWDNFNSENYDLDQASEVLTRYPIPTFEESDLEFESDPLDGYLGSFILAIIVAILVLIAFFAYGRVRRNQNLQELKRRYSDVGLAEESAGLLA